MKKNNKGATTLLAILFIVMIWRQIPIAFGTTDTSFPEERTRTPTALPTETVDKTENQRVTPPPVESIEVTMTPQKEVPTPMVSFGQGNAPNIDNIDWAQMTLDAVLVEGPSTRPEQGITYVGVAAISLERLDIPVGSFIDTSPCGPGTVTPKTNTGYKFRDGHPGFDCWCTDGYIRSPTKAIVWRLFDERLRGTQGYVTDGPAWASDKTGYGRAYILATRVLASELPSYVPIYTEDGHVIIIHVYGHLVYPDANENWPVMGDIVSPGEILGVMGNTGVSYGAHLHYGVAVVIEDGSLYWIDPTDYGGATY